MSKQSLILLHVCLQKQDKTPEVTKKKLELHYEHFLNICKKKLLCGIPFMFAFLHKIEIK